MQITGPALIVFFWFCLTYGLDELRLSALTQRSDETYRVDFYTQLALGFQVQLNRHQVHSN